MSLSNKIKALVAKAMVTVDDLASTVTYVQVTMGAYDPSNDTMAMTSTTYSNVRCVLVGLSTEDLDWWPGDMKGQKMLVAYNDLPIIPDDTDHVLIGSVQWNIYRVKRVPGDSLFTIYLREP